MSAEYLFISDCHLDASRPDITKNLLEFLATRARGARVLFILGDLFEVWLGDDDPTPSFAAVLDQLQLLSLTSKIFFLAGNRDFLLGAGYAEKSGLEIVTEPYLLTLGGERVLLMHGDTLCTDDTDYQSFRALVRTPAWQNDFLAKSFSEREKIAARLRSDSMTAMSTKSMEIMDVNEEAVQLSFAQHKANILIHGHTHRPARHRYTNNRTRFVLGDWNPSMSYLSWSNDRHFELHDRRVVNP